MAADRPVLIIARHRPPHELLLLAVSVVTGIAYTIGVPPPSSVAALLPHWAVLVWAGGLVVSGVIGLVAMVGRRLSMLQAEQASMLFGAAALIWYTVALIPFGAKALFAASISIAWAVANLARAVQIRHDLRRFGVPIARNQDDG